MRRGMAHSHPGTGVAVAAAHSHVGCVPQLLRACHFDGRRVRVCAPRVDARCVLVLTVPHLRGRRCTEHRDGIQRTGGVLQPGTGASCNARCRHRGQAARRSGTRLVPVVYVAVFAGCGVRVRPVHARDTQAADTSILVWTHRSSCRAKNWRRARRLLLSRPGPSSRVSYRRELGALEHSVGHTSCQRCSCVRTVPCVSLRAGRGPQF